MPLHSVTPDSSHRNQARAIIFSGAALLLLASLFGVLSLSHFSAVETAWETHNARATAIGSALSELKRHIGYGGFIHNFKNLVLRRDLPRYQARIEADIVGFRSQLDRLDELLAAAGDKAALRQIRATFEEYAANYRKIPPMVSAGASSAELDAVVKVDDGPALKALAYLSEGASARARETERRAQASHADATRFSMIGGLLVLSTMLAATIVLLRFLRQLVAANEAIRQTRARLDTLLDTAPDPMLSVAEDGRIVRANQMAERFFGYDSGELLRMTVEQLVPERFRHRHAGQRADYFAAPQHRPMRRGVALTALTRDGREPSVEISLSHSGEGGEKLATITLRDVTEREQNRRALLEAKQQAESALARQREMQDELVQAEKLAALGGLVAGVAHEINTPVGVTLSAATHLEAETLKTDQAYQSGELSEEGLTDYFATAREAVRLMTINSQRAADLIQSFKQVAVDQTGGERRAFDVAAYIDEVLLSLQPHLKKTQVQVRVECPPELTLDSLPGAFSQVLTNLVMNALIHAFDPGQVGHITITVQPAGDRVELRFRDDGKGIPRELQARIFEPFFTTRRGTGGSGLGLHIVHTIVTQSLKGTLALASAPGEGSTFSLRLPRALPPSPSFPDRSP